VAGWQPIAASAAQQTPNPKPRRAERNGGSCRHPRRPSAMPPPRPLRASSSFPLPRCHPSPLPRHYRRPRLRGYASTSTCDAYHWQWCPLYPRPPMETFRNPWDHLPLGSQCRCRRPARPRQATIPWEFGAPADGNLILSISLFRPGLLLNPASFLAQTSSISLLIAVRYQMSIIHVFAVPCKPRISCSFDFCAISS